MDDLIEALQIAKKYASEYQLKYPTSCSHDELWLTIDPECVSEEDVARLGKIGFLKSEEGFCSFRFGSC